ncbi:8501_t:CDS:2 [Ambispora gerdemannii]|uniref:8501_t:CDS:1 n=1 Tax=Ambispora gerdemannii TaxID=144530 RepID=A0A9N9FW17_9GLOM|nr:8501_t:CDS:2 [Ambispora gerdemannii]
MAKLIATVIGILTSSILLHHLQNDIDGNTLKLRKKLKNTQDRLETALPGTWRIKSQEYPSFKTTPNQRAKLPIPTLTQTLNHIENRFIPTFKATWNDHIIRFTKLVNEIDVQDSIKSVTSDRWDKWQKSSQKK